MSYVSIDRGTISQIKYDYRAVSMTVEEIAEKYGIPESMVSKILTNLLMA